MPVFVTILLDLIGFGMILPLLPFYAQEYRASPAQIGWLFASYSLAQLVFAPLLGRLSDRVGRRPVVLACVSIGILGNLLFANAGTYLILLLSRSLAGLGAASYSIAQAYVADVTPPKDRSRAMGMVVGSAFGLGFILGPALGGFIAHFASHRAVPLTAAALGVINLLLALVWLRESLPPEVRGRSTGESWLDPRGIARVWHDTRLRAVILLFFVVTFCFSMMEATLALFCQARFGFGVPETSSLFVFIGVLLVGVQGGAVGPLVRRFGERRLILLGILLMGAGLLLLPWAPLWWLLLPSLALLAVGAGVHNPASLGLLSLLAGEGTQGGTSGVYRSFGALARTLGPVAGPWLFGAAGPTWPFWAAGLLMLAAFLPARLLLPRVDAG